MVQRVMNIDTSVWQRLEQTLTPGQVLRVGIKSGGCFGFQYTFDVDDYAGDDDVLFSQGELHVAVSKKHMPFLQEGTLFFVKDMMRAQFEFKHPKITEGCGCGVSFKIPE